MANRTTRPCGHAAVNNVFVGAVNRTGGEKAPDGSTTNFFGSSFIADFAGKMLVQAEDKDQILMTECDLERQKKVQKAWCFLHNRRPALYSRLSEEF